MKIAIVTGEVPSPLAGGIATVAHFLHRGLTERGISADFYCSERYADTGFPATYLRQFGPHPIHDLSFGYSFRQLGEKLLQYDVIDFHLPNARGPLLVHPVDPARCIATMHTTSIGYKRRVYEQLPYKYLARNEKRQKAGAINMAVALERCALKRAHIINCVADNLVEEVRDWYGMTNTVRTHKAVVLSDSGEVPLERAADAPYLFVGRLVAQKGLFDLLKAYRARRLTRPLHIVGDGALRAALEAQVRNDSLPVTFLGYRSNAEVSTAMKQAFALVAPSYYETQPMVAFEASAHALPVVAYQAAAVGNAVSPLNRPFLLSECDVAALSKALADLDAAPALAREIGRANRDLHLRENRFARMIDDYVGLYETVARGA